MNKHVRVIVLNWNGRSWLEPCLTALRRQTFHDFEVVLVDNASDDDSVELVQRLFPEIDVLGLPKNVGFAAGNNAGARGAKTQYLVFLNNDTEVDAGWLQALVDVADGDATAGLVTSHIVFLDRPEVVDSAGDGYLRCGGGFKYGHGQAVGDRSGTREVFGACGAAFLIRTDLFERLGGFDEDFFMVYEDVDLSYRARLAGSRCVFAAAALVRHAGSASIGPISSLAVYYGQRNLEWTWIKNSPRSILWRSLTAHVLYDLAGLAGYVRAGHLAAWVKGKTAAIAGLPAIWRKRRGVQRHAVADQRTLWTAMEPDWIAVKRREKRFAFQRKLNAASLRVE